MGFYGLASKSAQVTSPVRGVSLEFLHKHGCEVCPLNRQSGVRHPQLKAEGSDTPDVYMLYSAPDATDDARGTHMRGIFGRVLRRRIPEEWKTKLRWNFCVRTRPPGDREPTPVELACCRPSIVEDIERSKPKAIFGFGNIAIKWAIDQARQTYWNGKRVPVKIGKHTCWFFPMLDPEYVFESRKFTPRNENDYGSEAEFVFSRNITQALAIVDLLPEPVVHTEAGARADTEIIDGSGGDRDVARVLVFLNSLYACKVVGFDYETNGLRPYRQGAKILTVALSSPTKTLAFALYHAEAGWTKKQRDTVNDAFERFLYNARCRKVSHHLGFEAEWSAYFYGEAVLRAGLWEDSLSQAYILDERPGTRSLDFLCLQYFGLSIKDLSALDRADLSSEPVDKVLSYNAIDAKYHRLLYFAQSVVLTDTKMLKTYHRHLRRVIAAVLTQLKGLPVDQDIVHMHFDEFDGKRKEIERKLSELGAVMDYEAKKGKAFRPSANHDIMHLLHSIGIHVDSTEESVINKFDHPFIKLILDWREYSKLLSTYIEPLITGSESSVVYPDGLTHPILVTTKTRTWRTSSEEPNIQNVPNRGPNRKIRKQVNPGGDLRVVSFDYAGIQARNVAMESKDKTLVDAFWNNYDIHSDWLNRIVKHWPQWVDGGPKALADKTVQKAYRNRAKNELVFPSFFGAQAKSVGGNLGVPENISLALIEEFWNEFPDIKGWHESIERMYQRKGYVTGLSGFRRHAPISQNQLINAPIQGDEAIIVCDAMIRLSEMEEPRFQADIMIHDDLTFIWGKAEVERNAEIVIKEMIKIEFPWINVPLVVEMKVGKDWCDQTAAGEYTSNGWNGIVQLTTEV